MWTELGLEASYSVDRVGTRGKLQQDPHSRFLDMGWHQTDHTCLVRNSKTEVK